MKFYTVDERIIPETKLDEEYGRLICEHRINARGCTFADFCKTLRDYTVADKSYFGISACTKSIGKYKFKYTVREVGYVVVDSPLPEMAEEAANDSVVDMTPDMDWEEEHLNVVCYHCNNEVPINELECVDGVNVCKTCAELMKKGWK